MAELTEDMEVVVGYPPNFEELKLYFNIESSAEVCFCYGHKIFNPYNLTLRPDLIFHESVHAVQQDECGGAEAWWKQYIASASFRVNQEAEAYGEQVKFIRSTLGESWALKGLSAFAKYLSSPVYANAISQKDAFELIRKISRA